MFEAGFLLFLKDLEWIKVEHLLSQLLVIYALSAYYLKDSQEQALVLFESPRSYGIGYLNNKMHSF